MEPQSESTKPQLCLLISHFWHPAKDLAATSLAWMCKARGIAFDVYYAAGRDDGGIFSPHGSGVLGGRHVAAISRALARHETTVVKLGEVSLFHSLFDGAIEVIDAPESLADLYSLWAKRIDLPLPDVAVAYQMQGLPPGLMHGETRPVRSSEGHKLSDVGAPRKGSTVPYAFCEATGRQALAVALEADDMEIARLRAMGVTQLWTVATAEADSSRWAAAGFGPQPADVLTFDDDLTSFTFRVAQRWLDGASALDLTEPLLASHLLPFAVRENRLLVYGTTMREGATRLASLAASKGQTTIYGRYAGGATVGAISDEDLFDLFSRGLAFQVIEPGRPPLTVNGHEAARFPQPAQSPFDLEPSDEELQAWAGENRVLVSILTHSGELSHIDAVASVFDLSATTGVKAGVGVHYARYAFDPEGAEMMQVPVAEGGVLGLCEPVLHSNGFGIIVESMDDPQHVAASMLAAREGIARLAGARFAPRGVYCYCDAVPRHWAQKVEPLWDAIREVGFEYVVSTVSQGNPSVLYRDGDFVVLNQCGVSHYPFSPFARIDTAEDLADMERRLAERRRPSWILGVLDIPIYGYSNYLSLGDPFKERGGLGPFYAYIRKGGESGELISATPHTIARYARIIADMDLL